MGQRTNTRERIVGAALGAMRERGFNATAISDLVVDAEAPRGSITFHFPDGKDEIAREVVALHTTRLLAEIDALAHAAPSARAFLDATIDRIGNEFAESEYVAGCPVVPIVIERGTRSNELRELAASFFLQWRQHLTEHLIAFGLSAQRGQAIATLSVSAIEGALVICRAERSLDALNTTQCELQRILEAEAHPAP